MAQAVKQKSLKVNATLSLIKTFMSLIFPLITFPYSSRIIGPIYIGKVNFASSVVQYFTLIAALGITAHATREIAKVRDNYDELCKKTAEFFRINFFSMIFAYVLFIVALLFVPKFSEYRTLLLIYSVTILLNPFGMDWINNAMEDFGYITSRTILFQIISLSLLFTTVHTKEDYLRYAAISVISSAGANVLNFIHVQKYISFKYFFSKLDIKQHFKPIIILFAMAIATQVYSLVDNIMIGFLKDDYNVGLYSAATKINKIVLSVVTAGTTILLPRLAYYFKNEGFDKFKELAYKGFDILLLISIPCAVGLNIVSKNATLLLSGKSFIEAIPVMKIMNPIIVITGLSGFIGSQIFIPLNKEKWTLMSVLTGVLVNITLNAIFVPLYGAKGAAIGTICSETTVFIINTILLSRVINILPVIKKFFIYLANSIVMAVPVYLLIKTIDNIILGFITAIVAGIFTYLIILLLERNKMLYNMLNAFKNKFGNRKVQ